MNTWQENQFVALDLEGTGARDREKEEILEIAAVLITNGRPTTTSFHTLVNPGRSIPQGPWAVHGLTDADVKDSPYFDQIVPELTAFLDGNILVAHNAGVDWRLLHRKCPTLQPEAVIDTLTLSRHLFSRVGRHGLADLIAGLISVQCCRRWMSSDRTERCTTRQQ